MLKGKIKNNEGDGILKKFNIIIMSLFTFLIALIGINNVDAATYNGKLYEVWDTNSGVNVYGAELNGWMDYNSWMIKSTADNKIYYCIDPATPLEGSSVGSHKVYTDETDIINNSALTKSKLKKVRLLAYYGYGYKDNYHDHTSKKWYGITQVMIWRVMRPDLTWTFKKTRNGPASNKYFASEVAEMNKLVKNFDKNPSFHAKTYKVLTGSSITIEDTNKVLYQSRQSGTNSKVSVKQNENKLTISSNAEPSVNNIKFKFKSYTNDSFGAFVSSEFQDIIKVGSPSEKYSQVNIEVYGGKINLQKIDGTTEKALAQGEATLSGAVYDVFDSSNKKVGSITTDKNGKGNIILDYGTYTLREVKAPKGYKINNKEYVVIISKDNYNQNVEVSDKVITGKVKLVKTKGGSGEKFTEEINATFNILDKDGKVVETIKTNNKGMAIVTLPYGTYTLHQTSGDDGYIFTDDIVMELYEDKIYEFNIQNLKPSKLIFSKVDYSSGKPLPNTIVEIYKEDGTLMYTCKTDKNGKCEIPNLEIGKYYILEKRAPKYYKLNPDKMPFEVTKNGEVIKATMKNERNHGTLIFTKTDKSEKKKLEGALIEIYFTETNERVFRGTTDKNGLIKLDGIKAGKYCIYERKSPDGYEITKKPICFEITDDEEIININMTNNEKIIVPDTKLNDYTYIICAVIVSIGVGYLIYENKKN